MRDFAVVLERCAVRMRQNAAEAARLFHGRGRTFPGYEDINVDLYPPVVLVACFSGDEAGARALARRLALELPQVRGVGLQLRAGRRARLVTAQGHLPEELTVCEAGLSYRIRLTGNLNVGLFLDAAPARCWVRQAADGARVLNLFAYTCAFSVAAVAGGAARVLNVDMSRRALAWGRANHAANGHDPRHVDMLPQNVFKAWPSLRRRAPFDLVIVDPPTAQRGSFNAERQYARVLKRLKDLTAPGARVLACLNSPYLNRDFLPAQMARWCPDFAFVEYLPPSPDFPDESADRALKVAVFRRST